MSVAQAFSSILRRFLSAVGSFRKKAANSISCEKVVIHG